MASQVIDERLSDQLAAPIAATDRIASLDVLRGFTLLGILLANIQDFASPTGILHDIPLDVVSQRGAHHALDVAGRASCLLQRSIVRSSLVQHQASIQASDAAGCRSWLPYTYGFYVNLGDLLLPDLPSAEYAFGLSRSIGVQAYGQAGCSGPRGRLPYNSIMSDCRL